ncbi:MAG: EAL domain-containing protein [Burkholderiales bacterium]
MFVSLVASAGLAYNLSDPGETWAWQWLLAVVTVSVLRLVVDIAVRRLLVPARPTARRVRRLTAVQSVSVMAGALLWSYVGWFGLIDQDMDGRFKIIIILCAMVGGATGTLASLRWTGRLYIVALLIPLCVKLALPPIGDAVLALLGGVFFAVMLIGLRNNHTLILHSLDLQEDNLDLVRNLKGKNAEVQAMNHLLEDRVEQRTQDLQSMAHHDALTGLLNRRGIVQGLDRLQAHSPPQGDADVLGVLFLDLDRFKQINDGIGHDVGDLVLVQVARRFKACVPAQAVFGRWGGDEFIVVLGGPQVRDTALAVAARLQASLEDSIEVHGERLNLGVSIGVALFPSHANSPAELIRAADLAAAEAKRQGRDRVVEFHEAMSATQRRRLEIVLALRLATRDDSLRLVYQPIIDARTGRVSALEALLRWRSPTVGEVRPDEFIPIAEETDRIVAIGAWVLRRACRDAAQWRGQAVPPKVAVNVSVRQLLRTDFPSVVAAALHESGLSADRLALEVTESVFAEQNSAVALSTLVQLHEMGVQIDVDDFGTGYSSLSRLREFPLDAVKIDRSFVQVLDGPSCAIIEGTILMARRFGLQVIAEGIETRDQASHLLAMGVDSFQGFLFGRPHDVPRLQPLQPFWVGLLETTPTSGFAEHDTLPMPLDAADGRYVPRSPELSHTQY